MDTTLMSTTTNEPAQHYSVCDEDGTDIKFYGVLIGAASGQRRQHNHARNEEAKRCSACRWTEARVYRSMDVADNVYDGYVVELVGRTIVTGETDRRSAWRVQSPHSVVELLNSNRSSTLAARLALAEAAGRDAALEEAYINRAE